MLDVKVPKNPRLTQDDEGQWWYQIGGPKIKGRASSAICVNCGEEFLRYPGHRNEHCSRRCATKCRQGVSGHCAPRVYDFAAEKNGQWNGGRWLDASGYFHVRTGSEWIEKHKRRQSRYRLEHRVVMEQVLGRPLAKNENVHHKNGIKHDNRPENLELWSIMQPTGQRSHEQKHCPTCTCNGG